MPISQADVDQFFDRNERLTGSRDQLAEQLAAAYEVGFRREGAPKSQAQLSAVEWARERAGKLIPDLDSTSRKRIKELVAKTIDDGESLGTLVKNLRQDGVVGPKARARTVARTETAFAHGEGGRTYAKSIGQDEKSWLTNGLDADAPCVDNEAAGWIPVDQEFPSGNMSYPAHPNCFIGDTKVVGGRVLASFERWYDGEVVILYTAAGHELTVTPNHPVLTLEGWVAAGLLHKGDYVVSSPVRDWGTRRHGHTDDVPTRIEDVAKTFLSSAVVTTSSWPVSSEDFHGDGANSEVAVVRTDRELWDRRQPTLLQQLLEVPLVVARSETLSLNGHRTGNPYLPGVGGTPSDTVGGLNVFKPLVWSTSRLLQAVSFGDTPPLSPAVDKEPTIDSPTADFETLRQALNRLTGEVALDKIIKVEREPNFSGHVYNLQTETELIVAEGIVTHNCRCDVIYRTAELYAEEEIYTVVPENESLDFVNNMTPKLTQDEKDSWGRYTSLDGYKSINSFSRYGPLSDAQQVFYRATNDELRVHVTNLDSAIEKTRVPKNITVFRGTHLKDPSIGSIYKDKGFLSVSLDRKVAGGFTETHVLEINVPKESRALPGTRNERELILPRNTSIRVTSISQEGELIIIHGDLV